MSFYPTPDTYDDQPTCPNCGYKFELDEPGFYREETYELECPDCDMKLECSGHMSWSFEIKHPFHCEVRGYHSPYVNVSDNPILNKHECLFCQAPLTCDCTLHDHCTHNLKTLEEVMPS